MNQSRIYFELSILVLIVLLLGGCAGPNPVYSHGREYSLVASATLAETPVRSPIDTPVYNETEKSSIEKVKSVTGTITYREKIALPPDAEVSIRLFDLSEFDALQTVIGEYKFVTGGKQVPFPFEVTYNPVSINQKLKYAVRATIVINGRPVFTSVERYLVLTRGSPSYANIQLRQLAALTGEFQELQMVKGHWYGGEPNAEVDSPRGRMRLVMGALAETLGQLPLKKDDLISLMGQPDSIRTLDNEEHLIYLWRNWHDYVYFIYHDGVAAGFKWWYAWE